MAAVKIGSLCSGLGGIEYGLEAAMPYAETVWQVECDPFCLQVLAHYWPNTERHTDVRTVTDLPPVDLICFGFPCTDLSIAGAQAGLKWAPSMRKWPSCIALQEKFPGGRRVQVVEWLMGFPRNFVRTAMQSCRQ